MYRIPNKSLSLPPPLSLRFNGHFPGESGLAGFIEAKDDGSGGDNWSCNYAKLQSNHHHQQTKPTPNFLQAECSSCHTTNSVKALKGKEYVIK